MSKLLNQTAATDAETATDAEAATTATIPTAILDESGSFSEGWHKEHQDLIPYSKSLEKFNNPVALAKSYGVLERNRLVPGSDASDDAVEAFRRANNIPASVDDYTVSLPESLPEGLSLDDNTLSKYKEAMHGANLTQAQAQALIEANIKIEEDLYKNAQAEVHRSEQDAISSLRNEWGSGFEAKLENAQRAFDSLCLRAGVDAESLPFINDIGFVKLMTAISEMSSESSFHASSGSSSGSFQGNKSQANDIISNPENSDHTAYWDRSNPRHDHVVDTVARMLQN